MEIYRVYYWLLLVLLILKYMVCQKITLKYIQYQIFSDFYLSPIHIDYFYFYQSNASFKNMKIYV